ncbi:MAG TPA: phosphatase PAP2 family protein [candidate division Zixibacteria bacterium]|nr:phosphatase PAP2 family protein [candidate division Zixibacteria bacterium]HEQ98347.1 phosphatase PAP2 family protein [candidate division Zixibacteria bacterium]
MKKVGSYKILLILSILFFSFRPLPADDREYLSSTEITGISAGSIALGAAGLWALDFDSTRRPVISGPAPWEESIQRFLGGRYYPGKTNWLDHSFGSSITPILMGGLLLGADISWPRYDRAKDVWQDMFLYGAGLLATKGVTGITKGFFARPRPMVALEPELYNRNKNNDYAQDRASFFSGHTSSAFFSTAFLNMRIRQIMRQEMTYNDYKDWRWLPPTILFGWASYVGYTRIDAYKHYITDVVFGALAGWVMAELFYHFGDNIEKPRDSSSRGKVLFKIGFSF